MGIGWDGKTTKNKGLIVRGYVVVTAPQQFGFKWGLVEVVTMCYGEYQNASLICMQFAWRWKGFGINLSFNNTSHAMISIRCNLGGMKFAP